MAREAGILAKVEIVEIPRAVNHVFNLRGNQYFYHGSLKSNEYAFYLKKDNP